MNKKDILLKVSDAEDWLSDIEGAKISVSVWHKDEDFMVDSHITEQFEEINSIEGLFEESEGDMIYYGNLSIEELSVVLNKMGFETEVSKKQN